MLRGLAQTVHEHADGVGMKGSLRLLDADEPRSRRRGDALEQRGQDAQGAQRSVGHGEGIEPHGVSSFLVPLQEFHAILEAAARDTNGVDPVHGRAEVFLDPRLGRRMLVGEASKRAGEIASVPRQGIPGNRVRGPANGFRIEVVEGHARQSLVNRLEFHDARGSQQVQALPRRGRRPIDIAGLDDAVTERVVPALPIGFNDGALLSPESPGVRTVGLDLEREMPAARVQPEFQPHSEGLRRVVRASSHGSRSATLPERKTHGVTQSVRDQSDRVHETALSGAVRADEQRQRAEPHIAGRDVPIVPENDPAEEHCVPVVRHFDHRAVTRRRAAGWMRGLEPPTAGTTIRCSAIELHPPTAGGARRRRPPSGWRAREDSNPRPAA